MVYGVGHLYHLMVGHLYHLVGGALWFNGWGSYEKVSCCFVWKYAQKMLVFRGVPFPIA